MKNAYFKRQIELIGEESLSVLHSKKVAIIGCGGLGCSMGIALAGSGIGVLHLVDHDRIELSNIHRQIAFGLGDINRPKCDALGAFLQGRSLEDLQINTFNEPFTEYVTRNINVDLIMDASDNISTRMQIDAFAKNAKIPWIYASVEAWHGMVCLLESSDFKSFHTKEHTPEGVMTPMVMHIASFASMLAVRYLLGTDVARDVLHYLMITNDGDVKVSRYAMPK